MSSIAGRTRTQSSNVSDLTTGDLGFLYGELCRPEGIDTARALLFSEDGPYPFSQSDNEAAEAVKQASLRRPVPVRFRQSKAYYDSDRDDPEPGENLPAQDVLIGQRLRWNGNKFDATLQDSGTIKLVQDTRNGLRLTSLNPNGRGIGRNGFRAHGATLAENLIEAFDQEDEIIRTQHELKAELDEMQAALDDEEAEDPDEQAMEQLRQQVEQYKAAAQAWADTVDQYLRFIDLAFGDSVAVDYDSQTFVAVPNQDRTAEAQFMAESIINGLDFIDAQGWYDACAYNPEEGLTELDATFA